MSSTIAAAAQRLRVAAEQRRHCAPVRDLIGTDVDAAYAVQAVSVAEATRQGRTRLGRKIGITSHAVQDQLGFDQPDFGTLLDDMQVTADETPIQCLL